MICSGPIHLAAGAVPVLNLSLHACIISTGAQHKLVPNTSAQSPAVSSDQCPSSGPADGVEQAVSHIRHQRSIPHAWQGLMMRAVSLTRHQSWAVTPACDTPCMHACQASEGIRIPKLSRVGALAHHCLVRLHWVFGSHLAYLGGAEGA